MMMFFRILLASLVLMAAIPTTQARPMGNAASCEAMIAARGSAKGLWLGTIRGQRQDMWDRIEDRYLEACFPSKASCERWLYEQRSYFKLNFWRDQCQCLR